MPVKVGDKAPAFSLIDTTKRIRTSSEFLGKKTVLAFYPAAFTGICAKEMCTFRDSLAELNTMNANVVAISVDPPFSNRAFAEQNKLNFPVLSDFTRYVSAQYTGLIADLGGIPGYTAAKRSVFVLDNDGVVKYAWISESAAAEPNYEEVKSVLASF
mgnify:CR=1 FL=1